MYGYEVGRLLLPSFLPSFLPPSFGHCVPYACRNLCLLVVGWFNDRWWCGAQADKVDAQQEQLANYERDLRLKLLHIKKLKGGLQDIAVSGKTRLDLRPIEKLFRPPPLLSAEDDADSDDDDDDNDDDDVGTAATGRGHEHEEDDDGGSSTRR